MIYIGRVGSVDASKFDECYAIVRSMKSPIEGFQQLAALSPSWELFKGYRRLVEARQWNRGSFERYYASTFLSEIKASPEARAWLNRLYQASEQDGKKIALVCFCADETLCHRSIVGGMLQGAGANVVFASGAMKDCSKYYSMYKAA